MNFVNDVLSYNGDKEIDYYKILGCSELASNEQIATEYRIRAKKLHPDKNEGFGEDISQQFTDLQEARDVLLDPKLRSEYNLWRSNGIAMSFKHWQSMRDSVKSSMHWAVKVKHDPMIEDVAKADVVIANELQRGINVQNQTEDIAETIRKFRNYEL